MTFETILNTIKNAICGKDVRQAIYEGLKSMNTQVQNNVDDYETLKTNVNINIANKIDNKNNVIAFNMLNDIIQNFYDIEHSISEKKELTWNSGYVYDSNGAIREYSSGAYTNVVEVAEGELYKIKTKNTGWIVGYVILDENNMLLEKSTNTAMSELIVCIPKYGTKLILSAAEKNDTNNCICYKFTKLITNNVLLDTESVEWHTLSKEMKKSLSPIKDRNNQTIKANYIISNDLVENHIIGATYIRVDNIQEGEVYSINYKRYGGDAIRIFDENNNIIPSKIVICVAWDMRLLNGIAKIDEDYVHLDNRKNMGTYYGNEQVSNNSCWTNPYEYFGVTREEVVKYTHEEIRNNDVNVEYCVKTVKHGWLPIVKNLEDYAGYEDSPIIGLAIRVDKGNIKYRVHTKSGRWLPYVTQFNLNDSINGYAGNDKEIDAIEVYYFTPDDISPYKKAMYKVNDYDWQFDNEVCYGQSYGQEGYAGKIGVTATKFQIIIK